MMTILLYDYPRLKKDQINHMSDINYIYTSNYNLIIYSQISLIGHEATGPINLPDHVQIFITHLHAHL